MIAYRSIALPAACTRSAARRISTAFITFGSMRPPMTLHASSACTSAAPSGSVIALTRAMSCTPGGTATSRRARTTAHRASSLRVGGTASSRSMHTTSAPLASAGARFSSASAPTKSVARRACCGIALLLRLEHVVVVDALVRFDGVGARADLGDHALLRGLHLLREREHVGDDFLRHDDGAVVVGHDEIAGAH